jgi:hypothetical protein
MRGMTPALWLGIAIFAGGFALRFWARRPFVEAYARLHQASPPASWPWTASDDPVVERWRRFTLLGTAMLWIGAILAILNPAI